MSIWMFLIYLAVTTIYGWVMYNRGFNTGVRDMIDMQLEAGIFKDKLEMLRKLAEHHLGKDNQEG
jgi:hypothetical protein